MSSLSRRSRLFKEYPRTAIALLLGAALLVSLAWPPSTASGPVSSLRVTDREGGLLREVRPEGRGRPVTLEAINPVVVAALLAIEDRHFYHHPGIDPLAMGRALWSNLRTGTVVSGASTLTMQVARVLRGRTGRGWRDKLAEIHLALRLEGALSKEEILTLWLNRVPFGNQAFGIEAAAQLYFGKPALDLTTAEAACLVGLPQSPSHYDPYRYPDRARARQQRVLQAMASAGILTTEESTRLATLPLDLVPPAPRFLAPHLVQSLLRTLPEEGPALLEMRTTIDPVLQRAVAALARGHLQRLGAAGVGNTAVLVLDNRTGEVLAYLGSVDFWDTRAGGQNDGVRMRRQPGSTLKPFTYALALASRRYTPASILPDIETPVLEAGGAFSPENYDKRYHGPVPLREALASSYNVPAIRLVRELGPDRLLETLHQAGFASLNQPAEHYGVGLTLGNGEVQLLELARAYAGLARGGDRPVLRFEQWRRSATGDTLRPPPAPGVPLGLAPEVIHLITDILSDPEARAPAFGRGGPLELPFPTAVKTGTSKDYRDNWAVGYTPRHTVAVWAGNFDGSPMRWVSGVTGAGALLKGIFLELGGGGDFPTSTGLLTAMVCPDGGARPGAFCPTRKVERFLPGTVPTDTCRVHRRVVIDQRSGLLADAETPPEARTDRLYTVFPPLFHPWMRDQGLPFPPQVRRAGGISGNGEARYSETLKILYPEDGTAFQLDPVLRPAFQQIRLRGAAPEDLYDMAWWVDDLRLTTPYPDARWTLTPGRHRLELRGVDAAGQQLRSLPVQITVNGARLPDKQSE